MGMIDPEQPNLLFPVLGAAVPFAISFMLAFVLYRDDTPASKVEIETPVPGKIVPLSEVPDETFFSGMLDVKQLPLSWQ